MTYLPEREKDDKLDGEKLGHSAGAKRGEWWCPAKERRVQWVERQVQWVDLCFNVSTMCVSADVVYQWTRKSRLGLFGCSDVA